MNELKMPWDEYKIRYATYSLTPRIVALKAFRDWLCDQPGALPLVIRFDSIEGHLQLLCVERVEAAVRFGAEQSREEIARLNAANSQLEQELADLRSREMDADDIASYAEAVRELRDKLEKTRKEMIRRSNIICERNVEIKRLEEEIADLKGEIHSCPVCHRTCKQCDCMEKEIAELKVEIERLKKENVRIAHRMWNHKSDADDAGMWKELFAEENETLREEIAELKRRLEERGD